MKPLTIGLWALCIATVGLAQPPQATAPTPRGQHMRQHGKQHRMPLQQLDLSAEQQTQLKQLNSNLKTELKTLQANESITVKQQRDQRYSLRKNHKAAVENLLTSTQKNKLADLKASAKQRHQAMADKKMAHLKTKLQLTDAQTTTIENNRAGIKTQLEALKQNEGLDRSAKQAELKRLKAQMQSNMNQVLTADQRTQFDKMRAERQQKMRHHQGKGMQNRRAEMVK